MSNSEFYEVAWRCAGAIVVLALAACSAPGIRTRDESEPTPKVTSVGAELIPSKADEEYQLSEGETTTEPIPSTNNRLPDFPAATLAMQDRTVTVNARLIVNEQGLVSAVTQLPPVSADQDAPLFFDATRRACLDWAFAPLIKSRRFQEEKTRPDGSIGSVWKTENISLPFHLDYAFEFVVRNGARSVSVGESSR